MSQHSPTPEARDEDDWSEELYEAYVLVCDLECQNLTAGPEDCEAIGKQLKEATQAFNKMHEEEEGSPYNHGK